MTIVQGKALLSSRTFWLNTLVSIGGGAAWLASVLPSKYVIYLLWVTNAANIGVRLITNQPITSLIDPAPKTIERPGGG